MKYALNVPINPVSFGQVSTCLLRETFYRSMFSPDDDPTIFPIGPVDLQSQANLDEDFANWLRGKLRSNLESHSRKDPVIKLWHLHGGFESVSEKQILFSFYELDSPTPFEKKVAEETRVLFSSEYTVNVFKEHGLDVGYVPLGFDRYNFQKLDKEYIDDDRIVFNVVGKLERRKNHDKIIKTWVKKYGNDRKYFLQCAIYNSFLQPEQNKQAYASFFEGKHYFNVQFLDYMPTNVAYNDFLNSGNIVIGMSGGEGWGLPEFQSVALGNHAVILNGSGYKGWANSENSVLVDPIGKTEVYDNFFFKKGAPFNQGNVFDFDEDDFIDGCEEAIKRVEDNRENTEGLKLQEQFTYENTLSLLLEELSKIS